MTLPPLVTFHFNALPLGRCFVFRRAASIPIDVFFRSGISWSKLDSHIRRFQTLTAPHGLFVLLFCSSRKMPLRAFFRVLHPCAGSQLTGTVCGLRLAKVRRLLFPDDVFDSLGFCLTKGNSHHIVSWNTLSRRALSGQQRVLRGTFVGQHHSTHSIRKGFISEFKVAMREHGNVEEWDFVGRISNPCLRTLSQSSLAIVSEVLKLIGVNLTATWLENNAADLVIDTQSGAHMAASLATVSLWRQK